MKTINIERANTMAEQNNNISGIVNTIIQPMVIISINLKIIKRK